MEWVAYYRLRTINRGKACTWWVNFRDRLRATRFHFLITKSEFIFVQLSIIRLSVYIFLYSVCCCFCHSSVLVWHSSLLLYLRRSDFNFTLCATAKFNNCLFSLLSPPFYSSANSIHASLQSHSSHNASQFEKHDSKAWDTSATNHVEEFAFWLKLFEIEIWLRTLSDLCYLGATHWNVVLGTTA